LPTRPGHSRGPARRSTKTPQPRHRLPWARWERRARSGMPRNSDASGSSGLAAGQSLITRPAQRHARHRSHRRRGRHRSFGQGDQLNRQSSPLLVTDPLL